VPEATVREWVAEGIVEWWGHRADMSDVLAQSSVVVLPTRYPEGVPRILIEAASCGRAIVTADVPGCRDIVVNGTTGVLVPAAGGGNALVEAVAGLLDDPARRAAMGAAGRARVEAHFSEAQVVRETLHEYVCALAGAR
jgi:glycosyltransferase involved in cell wall biosynthesis